MSQDAHSVPEIRALLAHARGTRLQALLDTLAEDTRAGVRSACDRAIRRETARKAEAERLARLYSLEAGLRKEGFMMIAGVDEVGRGAIAGPLSAGACILPELPRIEGIDDSKRLTPQRRAEIATIIKEIAISWCVAHVPAAEVDSLGVTAALRRAMGRALAGLEPAADHVLVDGLPIGVSASETAVVKGDSKVAAIAAASIVAKVDRDELMRGLALVHPGYGFEVNKGYGTPEHLQAVSKHGLCEQHRATFCPGGGTDSLF